MSWASNRYEAAFRDNAINEKVLPRVTAEESEGLVSLLLGTAARYLTPSPPCELAPMRKSGASRRRFEIGAPTPEDTAERRQVTVMFSDLARLDGPFGPHGPGGFARRSFRPIRNASPRP